MLLIGSCCDFVKFFLFDLTGHSCRLCMTFLREGVNLGCSFVSDIDVNVVWVWALLAVSLVGVFVIIGVVGAVGDL